MINEMTLHNKQRASYPFICVK